MLDARLRKNLDLSLLLMTLLVVCMGIVTLYSVSRDASTRYYQKQMVFFFVGICALLGASSIDYSRLQRYVRSLYFGNLALLVLVMGFSARKGAQRWIPIGSFQLQPSEFAKIILIVCLAVYLIHRMTTIHEFPTLLGSFAYIALPMVLVLKQPDLGTALVLVAIWFGMTYIAGARVLHLLAFLVAGVLLFATMWHFNILIKPYQKARLEVFINPDADPKDTGYHIKQSRIAVGSGQVWGKGFGQGTQSQGKFIPENHTDFIFTVIGEEGGFVFCTLLIVLYGGILIRGSIAIAQAEDMLGKLLATGIVSMYAFHVIVNIGMTIGIMPVTGVPLPLFSYGGSNLLLNLTAIGLLLGIGMRRHKLMF